MFKALWVSVCIVGCILILTACGSGQSQPAVESVAITEPTATPVAPPPTPTSASQNPLARGRYSMAYDSESERVILFGGVASDADVFDLYNDTWVYDYDANTWTEMQPAMGPEARVHSGIAYDAKSDRIILFGGVNTKDVDLQDTWAYDFNTNTWTEMKPMNAPSSRHQSQMVYDGESDRIILFGGTPSGFNFDDTWAYDYDANTWTEMKPDTKPSQRCSHQMAYDAESDRVIMWGGETSDKSVWAYNYNTNTWEESESSGGPQLFEQGAMVYDVAADRHILYKGFDMWTYDYNTNTWEKLELTPEQAPGYLSYHTLVYHNSSDRIITFGGGGGFTFNDETWVFDLNEIAWMKMGPNL